jgi:hypothetical protein
MGTSPLYDETASRNEQIGDLHGKREFYYSCLRVATGFIRVVLRRIYKIEDSAGSRSPQKK